MRRLLLITHLLFISFYCFAQQNLPGKIIGRIPDKNSAQKYEIQVGAFSVEKNTQQALAQLRRNGLNPVSEPYLNLTRVMIKGIPAAQVTNFLIIIKQAGFNEVIIRESGLTEDIQNLIPDDKLVAIRDLGIEINEGRNPPNIEGTYFVDTLLLVKSTTGNIARQWNKYVTFSKQNNSNLTINADYTMQANYGTGSMSLKGHGSFIIGEGNKFTVVVDGKREQGEFTAKTVEIFSGEISALGIINYHWAVMMIDDNGDPLNAWIENGTGYAKKDGDGISERSFK